MATCSGNKRVSAKTWLKGHIFLCVLVFFYCVILLVDGLREPMFCDESSFLKNVCGFIVYRTVEPIFINYPTFFSYLIALPIYLVYMIFFLFVRHYPWEGLWEPRLFALIFQGDVYIWLWVGRLIIVFFAAATMVLVYRYCLARFNRFIAVVAALWLLLSPYYFYMMYARYALPDVFVAFMATWIMIMASNYIDKPNIRNLSWAGFLAGLATGAKLNGALLLCPLIVLPWLVDGQGRRRVFLFLRILACAALGFFIASPCNVIKSKIYSAGFTLESELLYSHQSSLDFQWLIPSLWREDPVMTVLVLVVLLHSLIRRSRQDMLFHSLMIPSVIFLGSLSKHMAHYLLFTIPWIGILIGQFFQAALDGRWRRRIRILIIGLMISIVAYEGSRLGGRLLQHSKPDNRNLALAWMKKHIPRDHILMDIDYVPRMGFIDLVVMMPDDYINQNPYPDIVKYYAQREFPFYFSYITTYQSTINDLKQQGWDYFVTSESCFFSYIQDGAMPAWVAGSNTNFAEYLVRRAFYLRLFQQNAGRFDFTDGSGAGIHIFQLGR